MSDKDIPRSQIAETVFFRLGRLGFNALSDPEKAFVCVHGLQGEVDNGGFDQYFFNSSGDYALDTPKALEAIGAGKTANIARQANAFFGKKGPAPDRDARIKQLDSFTIETKQRLRELDTEFYRDEDHLDELVRRYVLAHRVVFGIKGNQ